MSDVPEELRYSKSHEWVRLDGDIMTIGITDHAQSLLGDIVFVELPEEGEQVNQGEEFSVVESVKAASDVYSPASGEVIAVNAELEDSPALVNQSPYGDGWFIQIKCREENDLAELMSADEYSLFIDEDA